MYFSFMMFSLHIFTGYKDENSFNETLQHVINFTDTADIVKSLFLPLHFWTVPQWTELFIVY